MVDTIIENVRIAVIDHDRMTREFIVDVLMYCVNRHIQSFENALAFKNYQLKSRPMDLVLCEIHLPNQNGFDLLRFVKKQYPQTCFIAISANPEDQATADELGADVFLTKPLLLKELFDIVQHYVVGDAA
jgi:DNA-binding response OmpR family regulator